VRNASQKNRLPQAACNDGCVEAVPRNVADGDDECIADRWNVRRIEREVGRAGQTFGKKHFLQRLLPFVDIRIRPEPAQHATVGRRFVRRRVRRFVPDRFEYELPPRFYAASLVVEPTSQGLATTSSRTRLYTSSAIMNVTGSTFRYVHRNGRKRTGDRDRPRCTRARYARGCNGVVTVPLRSSTIFPCVLRFASSRYASRTAAKG